MDTKTLKTLFDSGSLTEAIITEKPLEPETWILSVIDRHDREIPVTIVRKKDAKSYKNVDSVLNDLRKIGFKKATFCLAE